MVNFIRWTDWILDGDVVVYSTMGRGYPSTGASDCRWLVPGTGELAQL